MTTMLVGLVVIRNKVIVAFVHISAYTGDVLYHHLYLAVHSFHTTVICYIPIRECEADGQLTRVYFA